MVWVFWMLAFFPAAMSIEYIESDLPEDGKLKNWQRALIIAFWPVICATVAAAFAAWLLGELWGWLKR